MGGLARLKPVIVTASERQPFSCTTKGCPDEAILILPLNETVLRPMRGYGLWNEISSEQARLGNVQLEMRLCRRCIRTLATALPPGMRLPGARLRYPEVAPLILAAHEINGTPEHIQFMATLERMIDTDTGDSVDYEPVPVRPKRTVDQLRKLSR